ncbi:TPA: hypothetical protein U3R04_001566 [Streptococcus agalactiae]|nr:hypothetical protein [Streptococcus agalactiae]
MSYFYYRFLKTIKQYLSMGDLFLLQLFKYLFYIFGVAIIYDFVSNPIRYKKESQLQFFLFGLLFFFIGKIFSDKCINKIYSATPDLKKHFRKKDMVLLQNEIEQSLTKTSSFAKWTCGIVATIITLFLTIFSNFYINFLISTVPKKELIEFLNQMDFQNTKDIFVYTSFTVLFIVLGSYLILQSSTYNKRLVLTVLKNCQYEGFYALENKETFNKDWNPK